MIIEWVGVGICAFFTSLLTFYTGFGLGTLLMPILAIFFPVPLAIVLTAIVHLFHGLLKGMLLWKSIDWKVTLNFGVAAAVAAIPGAWVLEKLSFLRPIYEYTLLGVGGSITYLKIIIGLLLITAGLMNGRSQQIGGVEHPLLAGAASGFLGGFSGNQGAFRSLFLIHLSRNKSRFIATSAAISIGVDLVRLLIYHSSFSSLLITQSHSLLLFAIGGASFGVVVGVTFLEKVKMRSIEELVQVGLCLLGLLMIAGLVR